MNRTIYINFTDLNDETREDILSLAVEDIRKSELKEIVKTYGKERADEIITERAERKIYEYDYIFNV